MLRESFARVAIVDVDLHHGNGTQDIFYARRDVWTGSLHADPADFYPFFWGGVEETGEGEGEGANVNLPLPLGSGGQVFLDGWNRCSPGWPITSPGHGGSARPGCHKADPLAGLALETGDFTAVGRQLAELDLPTVLVQEGGYPTDELGHNLAAFMAGFAGVREGTCQ